MPFLNRITGINGVVQGGTATVALETGPRYHFLQFNLFVEGVATLASTVVDTVRVKVNEIAIWEISAADLLKLNTFNNVPDPTGTLSLHFSEPGRADKMDEVFTAWDTFSERSFTVELVLKTLVDPTDVVRIEGSKSFDFLMWKNADGSRGKNIVRRQKITENLAAGQYDITKLPIRFPILAVHLDAANAITYLEVDADGRRVWEASDTNNETILGYYGLDSDTFAYSFCPIYREQISDFLAVKSTLNLRTTTGSAQAVSCIVETLTPGFV